MRVFFVIIMMMILASQAGAAVLWSDGFELYQVGITTWHHEVDANCPWYRPVPPPGNSQIVADANTVGGNASKKFTGTPWYTAWNYRAFGSDVGSADVQVTARVAQYLNGAPPSAVGWPLSNHVIMSNMGIGIDAGNISYGVVDYNNTTKNVSRNYTHVAVIDGEIWYDVKIIIHQIAGTNNDTADLYYKRYYDNQWTTIATNVNTNHDLDGKVWLHSYNSDTNKYKGFIDDVVLSSPPLAPGCQDVHTYLPADLDQNCYVDFGDLAIMAAQWMTCNEPGNIMCN